jgi:hypothetical protein
LEYPVSAEQLPNDSEIKITVNYAYQFINIKSTRELSHINVYNILGKKVGSINCHRNMAEIQTNGLISGIYLIHVFEKKGNLTVKKVLISNNQH